VIILYLTTRQLHNYTNVATAYSVKIVDTSYLTFFHKYFINVCESLAQLLLTNDIIMARCTRRSSYTHIYIRVEQLLWNYVFTRIIDIISPSSYLDIYACLWHKTIICCDQIMWKKKDFLDFSLNCASHNLANNDKMSACSVNNWIYEIILYDFSHKMLNKNSYIFFSISGKTIFELLRIFFRTSLPSSLGDKKNCESF